MRNAGDAREDRGDSRECAGRRASGGEAVQLAHAGQPLAARPRHQRGAGRRHHDASRYRPRPCCGAPRRAGISARVQRAADAVEPGEHARRQGRRPRRLPPALPRPPLFLLQPPGTAAQRGSHHGHHYQQAGQDGVVRMPRTVRSPPRSPAHSPAHTPAYTPARLL